MNFHVTLCFVLIALGNWMIGIKLQDGRESVAALQERVLVLEKEQVKLKIEINELLIED